MTGLGWPFTQMTVGSGTQCSTHEAVSVGNTVVGGTGASVGKCQTGGGTNSVVVVVVVVVGEAPPGPGAGEPNGHGGGRITLGMGDAVTKGTTGVMIKGRGLTLAWGTTTSGMLKPRGICTLE